MCAGAGTSASSRFSANSSYFLFVELLVNRASFLGPNRYIALLLDLKMYFMSPAVAM